MINITYMISILNSVFIVVFYATRWIKQNYIYIYFEEIYINLICSIFTYIYIYNPY
jgi:hypothetical protein